MPLSFQIPPKFLICQAMLNNLEWNHEYTWEQENQLSFLNEPFNYSKSGLKLFSYLIPVIWWENESQHSLKRAGHTGILVQMYSTHLLFCRVEKKNFLVLVTAGVWAFKFLQCICMKSDTAGCSAHFRVETQRILRGKWYIHFILCWTLLITACNALLWGLLNSEEGNLEWRVVGIEAVNFFNQMGK